MPPENNTAESQIQAELARHKDLLATAVREKWAMLPIPTAEKEWHLRFDAFVQNAKLFNSRQLQLTRNRRNAT